MEKVSSYMYDRVLNKLLSIPKRTAFKLFKLTGSGRQRIKILKKQTKQKRNSLQIACASPTREPRKYRSSYSNLLFKKYNFFFLLFSMKARCVYAIFPHFLCDFLTRWLPLANHETPVKHLWWSFLQKQ